MKIVSFFLIAYLMLVDPACELLCEASPDIISTSAKPSCHNSASTNQEPIKLPENASCNCCDVAWGISPAFILIVQFSRTPSFNDFLSNFSNQKVLFLFLGLRIHSPPDYVPNAEFGIQVFSAHAPPLLLS